MADFRSPKGLPVTIKMPGCCVINCSVHSSKNAIVSFHQFPSNPDRKKLWLRNIRRDIGPNFKPSKSTKVCSVHFKTEDFIKKGKRSCLTPDAVPTIFAWSRPEKTCRKPPKERPCNINMSIAAEETVGTINQTDIEVQAQDFEKELDVSHTTMCKYIPPPTQDHDYSVPSQDNMEMLIAASLEIERLNAMIENVNKSKSFIFRLSKDSTQVSFYTGFKDYETLMLFYQIIEPTAASMTRYSQYKRIQGGKSKSTRVCFPTQALSLLDQFLLVIKKLRVGNFNQELADEFGVSPATVSRLTISWCNYLYFFLGSQPLWPSKAQVNDHMPDVFREYYSNTRVILDCTEIFVQRPSSLYLNSEFYSHYKGTTTLKGLVGIMPSGAISFVSSLHLGSISDKAITRLSGILDLLEPGDQVMVDKGFVIKDLLEEVGASLVIPPFLTANRSQFEADEVSMTQSIARLRVHVERAIRRVKCYHIFDRPIPLTLAGSINQIWSVCCLLTNFYGNLF
ncbi:THAP domain-containing protein 3 [Nymphon striatum]|nr:THAP domain-containing protein 3 [Nymphon striatum]